MAPARDPDKPDCPYLPGFEVDVETHAPPPPFGNRLYASRPRPFMTDEWLDSVTQTKHVLTYPPLETPPPLPSQHDIARLTITKSIATGNARGAQLVLCLISPQKTGAKAFVAVAKIFDPFYYSFLSDIGHSPVDVVRQADQDYSREAAAYECLRKTDQTGSFTPAYFGSWTFSLLISYKGQTRKRPVRLVLIEYLAGTCMKDLFVRTGPGQFDALHLSENYRLLVLAILLDGVVRQYHAGVSQRHLAPRNIILVPPPDKTQDANPPRVVLIDYNISTVWDLTKYGKQANQLTKLPQNPIKQFWDDDLSDFAGWYQPRWLFKPSLFQEWLLREFGGAEKVLYEPVEDKLEFTE